MRKNRVLVTQGYGGHHRVGLTLAAMMTLAAVVALAPGFSGRLSQARAETGANHTISTVTPRPVGLAFSDDPPDEEFLRTGLFAQPLVPVGRTTYEENRHFAAALLAYSTSLRHGDRDAVEPILSFLAAHPHSAWKPVLQVNLGALYRQTGHFAKALTTWQGAWDDAKSLTDPNGRAIGDAAAASLSQFEAYLGRKETLTLLLAELKTRPIRGSAAELVSESSRGLAEMQTRPEVSFKCGPSALARILAAQASAAPPQSRRVLETAQSTPDGLTLSAVQAISVDAGMHYQMAFRSMGAPVILPAVVHWKVGHYAALLGKDGTGHYWVGDPTFGEDIRLSPSTFDEEASGYFLVPPGALPSGWRSVDAAEGSAVWGRGNTGANRDNGATGAQEIHAFPCGSGGGCATWNVEAMMLGLSLHDDPIGYTPPLGPPIRFPMDYSHRDMQQPMRFTYTNFGNKWTTSWLSYVTARAGCAGFYGNEVQAVLSGAVGGVLVGPSPNPDCALLCRRGGGSEPYVFPGTQFAHGGSAVEQSALGQFSQAILTQFTNTDSGTVTGFRRTLPDGSIEKFEQQMGGKYFFMTEVDDPQGNAVKITYDQQMRLVALTDALGQVTTICYNDSWQTALAACWQPPASSNPPSNLQVTQVTDPFGRSAYFGYDPQPLVAGGTSHLTSITDVLGITSTFVYAAGSDFISSLTTPYGTTTFVFTDSTNDASAGSTRSVTITDPLQRVSYVEFHQGDTHCSTANAVDGDATFVDPNHIACNERSTPVGMHTFNDYLQYRNTFVWDPYQNQNAWCSTSLHYTCARLIHWLHTNDSNMLTASRTPESIKQPLEHRIWFNYGHQDTNAFPGNSSLAVGSTNQRTAIGRVLDDGSTQLWQYAYNPYGKLTQITDPIGRQLTLTYATNGLDVLTVTNTTTISDPKGNTVYHDVLLTLADYNTQHEPRTVVAANGQSTSFTYNASGQIATVTDPLHHTWTYAYQPTGGGYLQNVAGPAAPQVPQYTLTYDAFGRLNTVTNATGTTLTYSYDAANRLTQTFYPDQTTELRGYTLLDLTSVMDRRGNWTFRQYDADRELWKIIEPSARMTVLQYWPNGRLQSIQDPQGNETTFQLDIAGRPISVQYPADSRISQYYYDGAGRVNGIQLPGGTTNSTVNYSYYADNTVSEVKPGGNTPTFFTYDRAYRRLTAWYQADSLPSDTNTPLIKSSEQFSYYPVTSPPSLGATRVQKDVTVITDQNSRDPWIRPTTASTYTYDALDRILSRTLTPAVPPDVRIPTESLVESWNYDALGRVISNSNQLDSFTYTYVDPSPRVQQRTSAGGPQLAATYYPPQGGQLLRQLTYATPGGTSLAQYQYEYDANHNITQFAETYPPALTHTVNYTYDPYNQLQSWSSSGPFYYTYAYDANGNRTTANTAILFGGSTVPLTHTQASYGASNEITSITTTGLLAGQPTTNAGTYDGNGALISIGGPTYTYDTMGRLVKVVNGTQSTNVYYDGLRRVVQIVDAVAGGSVANHSYAWCGNVRCVELDNMNLIPASTISTQTMPAPDKVYFGQGMVEFLHSAISGPVTAREYYVKDAVGSIRQLVGGQPLFGSVVAQYEYDPYGKQTKVSGGNGPDSDFGFAGYFSHRASGLDFALRRVYSPQLGRWLTRDPIGNSWAFSSRTGFNATDLNLYAYVDNNPTSVVDPTGNCPACIVIAIGIVLGYGAFAPSDTAQAPADLGALMTITGGGFGAMNALASTSAAAAVCAVSATGAESETTSLFRAVTNAERESIQSLKAFYNPPGNEVKYFSTTLEGAQSYASQATAAYGEGPFTIVSTSIPTSSITPEMTVIVDRGISTIVVPTELLPTLSPPVVLP
jgi:RHS repeat-associated protein